MDYYLEGIKILNHFMMVDIRMTSLHFCSSIYVIFFLVRKNLSPLAIISGYSLIVKKNCRPEWRARFSTKQSHPEEEPYDSDI